jgi:hypothetical protein
MSGHLTDWFLDHSKQVRFIETNEYSRYLGLMREKQKHDTLLKFLEGTFGI